jgi:transcription initiation factor TFIIH subunit 3
VEVSYIRGICHVRLIGSSRWDESSGTIRVHTVYTCIKDNINNTMAVQDLHMVPSHPSSIPPSLLLLILDLHPLSWSLLSQTPPVGESKIPNVSINLNEFLNNLMVFLNAVLASSGGNQVVVYGATCGKSYVICLVFILTVTSTTPVTGRYWS